MAKQQSQGSSLRSESIEKARLSLSNQLPYNNNSQTNQLTEFVIAEINSYEISSGKHKYITGGFWKVVGNCVTFSWKSES